MNIPRKEFFAYPVLGALLVALDQATKYFAYRGQFGGFLNALLPVIGKKIFPNPNFAFSLQVPVVLMYVIYILLIAGLIAWFARHQPKTVKIKLAVTLIFAGAAANIFDRLYLGYVRDFIYVFWGNIFDLADIFIVIGILLLLA